MENLFHSGKIVPLKVEDIYPFSSSEPVKGKLFSLFYLSAAWLSGCLATGFCGYGMDIALLVG